MGTQMVENSIETLAFFSGDKSLDFQTVPSWHNAGFTGTGLDYVPGAGNLEEGSSQAATQSIIRMRQISPIGNNQNSAKSIEPGGYDERIYTDHK